MSTVPELDELLLGGVELCLWPGVAAGGAAALGRVQRGADEVRARPQLLADLPAVGGDQVRALGNLDVAFEFVQHPRLPLEALDSEAAPRLLHRWRPLLRRGSLALKPPQHRGRLVGRADQPRHHLRKSNIHVSSNPDPNLSPHFADVNIIAYLLHDKLDWPGSDGLWQGSEADPAQEAGGVALVVEVYHRAPRR